MARQQIGTSFHRIGELIREGKGDWRDLGLYEQLLHTPQYIVDAELMLAIDRPDLVKSVDAVLKSNIRRLPYPKMVMGIKAATDVGDLASGTYFVYFEEIDGPTGNRFKCIPVLYAKSLKQLGGDMALFPKNGNWYEIEIQEGGIFVTDQNDGHAFGQQDEIKWISVALYLAILLLNTRGVEKVHIQPTRLNKARMKVGKGRIPDHTVLRIGTVYDRNGKEVSSRINGHRRVHWRAGHVRNQRFGKDLGETRLIYIEPMLVNYKPEEDEVPNQPKRIVKL